MTSKLRRNTSIVILVGALSTLAVMLLRPPVRNLDSGIIFCERPAEDLNFEPDFAALVSELKNTYGESSNLNIQVIHHGTSNPLRIDKPVTESLATLIEENPQHRNSSVYLLNACIRFPDHPVCTSEVVDRASTLDRNNAAVWALVASYRYTQGNTYGAAVALDAANAAPEFNDYFQEQLSLIKTAIPEAQERLNGALHEQAYNHGLSMLISDYSAMNPLSVMCRVQTTNNPRLANACLDYGVRLAEEASTLTGIRMGERIQYSAHFGQGNDFEYRRIDFESRNRLRTMSRREARLADNLRDYDEQLSVYWYDQVILNGEQRSVDNLVAEASRRSSEANYNPCPGTQFTNALYNIRDMSGWLF
jgi:hypothetical protein